ncbi:CPBP family intramembrane glutamic endopeptidase [Virgibacillus sp. W0430]|uniref:CPBP family intramembrane glutamic endopeptidase n=1 Tax=Virgibacillus sp. W0430 TaxID=3391580 RepID=UPI003F48CDA6
MQKYKLHLFSVAALFIYIVLLNFTPSPVAYPFPETSKEELFQQLKKETEALKIPYIPHEKVDYFDVVANNSIGRFVEEQRIEDTELLQLQNETPLYTIQLDSLNHTYQLNPQSGKLIAATNIFIPLKDGNPERFVASYFGDGYVYHSETISKDSLFADWDLKRTYTKDTAFSNVINVVEVHTVDNHIVHFKQYGQADGFPLQQYETVGQIVLIGIILLFLFILFLIVTVQLIKRLIKQQIEAFLAPFILSIAAGIGWFFLTYAISGTITGLGLLEPILLTYLTLGTLLIRWKKTSLRSTEKWDRLKSSVGKGFLTAIIAITLGELFFYAASFFDVWVSPVLNFSMLLHINVWLLPLLTLFIGLSAAISEEAIFRLYMISFFDRFGVIVSIFATSVLWGILHIGYDMYPWYLYVIDFILITGPFFYFVYKKYSFQTVIFLHFFYNSWVMTLFLFAYDIRAALLSLVITFGPLFILFKRKKSSRT